MSDDEMISRAEVERRRAAVETESIGPRGSSVMVSPEGTIVFFKVDWDKAMQRVSAYGEDHEDMDSYTQWGAIKQEEITVTLELGWPELGERVMLYFPLGKWRVELGLVRDANGLMVLSPEAKGLEAMMKGVAVQPDGAFLGSVLAAYDMTDV